LSKGDKTPRTKADISNLLTLNLFDDVVFAAILDRLELNKSGNFTWIGHLDGIELGQVRVYFCIPFGIRWRVGCPQKGIDCPQL
jgi:hypothetical protein